MTQREIELKNQFENWIIKFSYNLLESPLFQPIGLELAACKIVLETRSDYFLSNLENSEIAASLFPVAFYRPYTDSIHIFIEHETFLKRELLQEKQAWLLFLLIHEASHRLLAHVNRGKDKDRMLWNVATDMEIHNTIYTYRELMKNNEEFTRSPVCSMINSYIGPWILDKSVPDRADALFDMEYLENIAEEIYSDIYDSKQEDTKTFKIGDGDDEKTVTVTVTTFKTRSGKTFTTTDVSFPNSVDQNDGADGGSQENDSMIRKTLMENSMKDYARQYEERTKGDTSCPCSKFLKKLFHIKVDWKSILRNSLVTALEVSEHFSWARPRTSLFGLPDAPYLPSQCEDEGAYGTVIIVRDESGSMTDEEVSKAASIIMEAKDYYQKIVVIKHDVLITSVNTFENIDPNITRMLFSRNSSGGTSHRDVFEWIRDYDIQNRDIERISCCIFITDMQSDILETQNILREDIPRIWLYPYAQDEYVKKNMKNVVGKKIVIES